MSCWKLVTDKLLTLITNELLEASDGQTTDKM